MLELETVFRSPVLTRKKTEFKLNVIFFLSETNGLNAEHYFIITVAFYCFTSSTCEMWINYGGRCILVLLDFHYNIFFLKSLLDVNYNDKYDSYDYHINLKENSA
jgi:hypothetical protein